MDENEFILYDRLEKIRSVINQYGEENFYLSFSGGKDSTVLHHLIDEAISGNKIPRVYADTGIEYNMVRDFVKELAEKDERIQIIKPSKNIRTTLEEFGYPFKSKMHAHFVDLYRNGLSLESKTLKFYLNPDYIGKQNACPAKLTYQFDGWDGGFKISNKCCDKMKKEPLKQWMKEHKKTISIIGIMREEGGQRSGALCLAFKGDKLKSFHPLSPITKEWESWYIERNGIQLSAIYYPPYNFQRTGCKGCPFAVELQQELDTLQLYFPKEREQCERIWAPVYSEYRRIGYRLKEKEQMSIYDVQH